jgi:hypothetical protein
MAGNRMGTSLESEWGRLIPPRLYVDGGPLKGKVRAKLWMPHSCFLYSAKPDFPLSLLDQVECSILLFVLITYKCSNYQIREIEADHARLIIIRNKM